MLRSWLLQLGLPAWTSRYRCISTGAVHLKSKYDYHLLVVGGGSGGLACAKEASQLGASVAILDHVSPSTQGTTWGLGGTCVNVGCIPKKLFHQAGLLGQAVKDATSYGWAVKEMPNHLWDELTTAVGNHIRSLNWGYRVQLKQNGVDYFNAQGSFSDAHTVEFTSSQEHKSRLTAEHIVIAVGGRPKIPDNVPGAMEYSITSDDLFSLQRPPGRTLVVGGSYIALECAGILASLGQPTSLMVRSKCLRAFDQDLVSLVVGSLEREGVRMLRECEPREVRRESEVGQEGRLEVIWHNKSTGDTEKGEWDTVLFATGRKASTHSLELPLAGVRVDDDGKVIVDDAERTSAANIYAIGDVAKGRWELTPVAIQSGKLLSRRLFGGSKQWMDYNMVPTTVFTPLELAAIGFTEERAAAYYGENAVQVYHAFYHPLEFYLPAKETGTCYVKMVCVGTEERVVGLHMTGPNAGEMMQGFAVALKLGVTYRDMVSTVGIHPTCAEEVVKLHITRASGKDPTVTAC